MKSARLVIGAGDIFAGRGIATPPCLFGKRRFDKPQSGNADQNVWQ